MRLLLTLAGICVVSFTGTYLRAEAFQIIAAETPMGSGGGQGIRRYVVYETFGTFHQLQPIAGNLVDDPAGLAMKTPAELFVGNRAAHTGNSTIRRFHLTGSQFSPADVISGNHVTDCHQLAFDPVSGELFQTNWRSGKLSRFVFDAAGTAVPNGVIQMPDSREQLGVAVRPADRQLFVSDYDFVRRFLPNPDGTYSFVGNFSVQAGEFYHFMKFRADELYLAAFGTNRILRFAFDSQGNPVLKDAIPATGAVDMAFSPDEQEMFATNHRNGGIMRYRYNQLADTWTQHGDVLPTPMMGGIVVTSIACSLFADLTGDCQVNLDDLYVLAGQWLSQGDPQYCPWSADVGGEDCHVTIEDFAVLASEWLLQIGSP